MASALPPSPSSVNTNNYARLCRLLVVVGFQALKHTFDKIHSPAELHEDLTRSQARPTLQTLKKNGIISKDQWRKLYPIIPSSVSSGNFDISLLMLLLKNICGLEPPATGWESCPPAEDNSIAANIARLTYHRNKVYELPAIYSSVDDSTFNSYWEDISNVMVELGAGAISRARIKQLKTDTMDFELVEHYQELLKEWKKDDDDTKDKPEEVQSVKETEGDKQSCSMRCYDSPPQLSIKLPKASDVPQRKKRCSDVDLPIDVLLLTVEDCEFISCFFYLDEPFKSYFHKIGQVYFGFMGDGEEKLKIALTKCPKVSSVPSGALLSVKNAINVLRPKAVFSVGACTGLNSNKTTKLGDVVVSSKLTTHAFSTPVSINIGNIIRDIGYGWKAPLENPDEREVSVHCDADILSIPQAASFGLRHEDIIQHNPAAIAVETEGEGVFAAGHDDKIEWMVVKGIASYGDPGQSPNYKEWMSFASAMAASVVAKVLADPFVFQEWPHFNSAPRINIRVDCESITRFGAQGEAHRETVTAGSAVAITQDQSGRPPSTDEVMRSIASEYLQSDAQFKPHSFRNYLQDVRKLLVVDTHEGSLIFTVQCGSLEILEELWEDHRSGHLKEIAQHYLVTENILREFGEIEVNLATTVDGAEYEACKDFFLQQSRMLLDVESEEEEAPSSSGEIEGLLLKVESHEEQDTNKDESGEMEGISTSQINRHGHLPFLLPLCFRPCYPSLRRKSSSSIIKKKRNTQDAEGNPSDEKFENLTAKIAVKSNLLKGRHQEAEKGHPLFDELEPVMEPFPDFSPPRLYSGSSSITGKKLKIQDEEGNPTDEKLEKLAGKIAVKSKPLRRPHEEAWKGHQRFGLEPVTEPFSSLSPPRRYSGSSSITGKKIKIEDEEGNPSDEKLEDRTAKIAVKSKLLKGRHQEAEKGHPLFDELEPDAELFFSPPPSW